MGGVYGPGMAFSFLCCGAWFAIRTSGKFLNTISELLQALVWCNWCDRTWFYQFIKDGGSTVP